MLSGKWRPFCLGLNVLKSYKINICKTSNTQWGMSLKMTVLSCHPQTYAPLGNSNNTASAALAI